MNICIPFESDGRGLVMKLDYRFSNLCGSVYSDGSLIFSPDGDTILSPCGNRVNVFDLVNNKSVTLPFETRKNVRTMALSPSSALLLAIDTDGYAVLVNYQRRVVLHHFNFKQKVYTAKFSPDGNFFAVTHGKHVQVWQTPGKNREFAPFVLHREYTGHYDEVMTLDWSADSQFFVTGGRDNSCKIYSLHPIEGFTPATLSGHHDRIINAFFVDESIYSVSKDGTLIMWHQTDGGRWKQKAKHYFNQDHAKVKCVDIHKDTKVLVVGFNSGVFGLYEMPDFNNIHTLSISTKRITSVAVNPTGEWLAFGCSDLGQLLVWEWQSETYVLKQQGHYYDQNGLAYSPDGQLIATAGDDGKVKVWNALSGFCFVTFTEHTSAVTAIRFSSNGQVVFSASKDGTVRAFDLNRYRNFRTFTPPTPTQLSCLAVDHSTEVVVAGSLDTFQIYVWSVQTGKLLDVLSGHTGPVSGVAFHPNSETLVSCSWDKSVRVWDVYGSKGNVEKLDMNYEVLTVEYRPDGNEVACTTLDGHIHFWDPVEGKEVGVIEGRRDITGGRKQNDRRAAVTSADGKNFTTLCYSADGKVVIAGGNSKYVCLYDVRQRVLLKKFQISHNRALDGTLDYLHSGKMNESGTHGDSDYDSGSDLEDRLDKTLPGVAKGDMSRRKTKRAVRATCLRFSPTNRSWAATSTEGLLIYSLDDTLTFDPFDLDVDITPETTVQAAKDGEFLKAFVMSFRLNEVPVMEKVFTMTPASDIQPVVSEMPRQYLQRFLSFLADHMANSSHLGLHLTWSNTIFQEHGKYIKDNASSLLPMMRQLQKSIRRFQEGLSRMCDDNMYTLKYYATKHRRTDITEGDADNVDDQPDDGDDGEELGDMDPDLSDPSKFPGFY